MMLDFAIFAVTFVVALIIAVIYLYPTSRKTTTVPGLEASNQETGNLPEIERAGSLQEFLIDLHDQYGSIASFWMGQELVVSVASPKLFKEQQAVFDRPADLLRLFRPLHGSNSITFTNKADGRTRRTKYDKVFTRSAFKNSFSTYHKVSSDLAEKWSSMSGDQHIPLTQHMLALSFKILMLTLVGDYFKDDKKLLEFRKNFDVCWSITEESLAAEGFPAEGSQQYKRFHQAKSKLDDTLRDVLHKQRMRPKGNDLLFVDMVTLAGISEDTQVEDLLTFLVWGVHKTAYMLSWAIYFLATHQDVQEKLAKEINTAVGSVEVKEENVDKLRYLRQVLEETLRCSVLSPWAARVQDFDTELEGHKIPKNTPVIHALGVVLKSETWWAEPNKFDPDRFNSENTKSRPLLAFAPFGFAGKRPCPGAQLSYMMATSVLVTLLRKNKINMVEGQVVTPVHGIVTRPGDEIWITVDKRK